MPKKKVENKATPAETEPAPEKTTPDLPLLSKPKKAEQAGPPASTGPASVETPAAPTEMKITINLKAGQATIGISKPDCDPVFYVEPSLPPQGRLEEMVNEAIARWGVNPRNPKTTYKPPPPPAPPPRAASTARSTPAPAPAAPAKPKDTQRPLF